MGAKLNRGILSVAYIAFAVSTSLCADKNGENKSHYDTLSGARQASPSSRLRSLK